MPNEFFTAEAQSKRRVSLNFLYAEAQSLRLGGESITKSGFEMMMIIIGITNLI